MVHDVVGKWDGRMGKRDSYKVEVMGTGGGVGGRGGGRGGGGATYLA